MKRRDITLSREERQDLETLTRKGTVSARKVQRAKMLLKANTLGEHLSDTEIARQLECASTTVWRAKRLYAEQGLEAALEYARAVRFKPRKLDGRGEATLIALSCGEPPEGRCEWTLRLLADKLVELEVVTSISPEAVRRTLKKSTLTAPSRAVVHPATRQCRVRSARIEEVLDVYERPVDLRRSVVCLDERPCFLIGDTQEVIPAKPGQLVRFDYQYVRNGNATVFGLFAPHLGWREMWVTERTGPGGAALSKTTPHPHRVCRMLEVPRRRGFPRRRKDCVGDGQPQHPQQSFVVPRLSCLGSAPHCSEARVALHPQTWKLAQCRGDRVCCADQAVFGPTHSRPGDAETRSACLDGRA